MAAASCTRRPWFPSWDFSQVALRLHVSERVTAVLEMMEGRVKLDGSGGGV